MATPSEIVVLSKADEFSWLQNQLQDFASSLQITYCQTFKELYAAHFSPLLILMNEPANISDFRENLPSLRRDFPYTAFILLQENYDETLAKHYIAITSGHYLLKQQIALLDPMLRHILRWQETVSDRDGRIQRQQAALVSLATSAAISSGNWETAMREICSVTGKSLEVSRVSVWLFDALHSKIRCEMLYNLHDDCFEQGIELLAEDYPAYFAALQQNRTIAASNAHTHPDTSTFSEAYLNPLNIQSMLDATIRVNGTVIGTVCFEQQYEMRTWTIDDQVFAGAAADLCAVVIEGLEHRRIEESIKQTEKLQSLGLLASGIAHDFNNLLTVILNQASLLADNIDESNPAYKSLRHIVSTTRQASALTKQLLTYAGNKPVLIQGLSLKNFMDEQRDFLRLALAPHIDLHIADAKNLGIEADAIQLQQVLMNLVINAAEAMGTSRGSIHIEFHPEKLTNNFTRPHFYRSENFAAGDYVRITVRDTGSGIEESTLKRIFEPFFSTKSTGRGLGLATVLGVIRSHAGAMAVESTRGKGTSFHLYFRRASLEAIEKIATGAVPVVLARTILVVDDAPEIVESISEILEINGLNTVPAYNGTEALNIYRSYSDGIDLVLVDMSMPGMNGAETFEQLRKIKADAKVIVLSGYSDKELLRQFPNERPVALLAKPYDVNTLIETVWRHLA